MSDSTKLKNQIKDMLVENLMLQIQRGRHSATTSHCSVRTALVWIALDVLQLVVALEKNYGLKISDPEVARGIFHGNVNSIAAQP